MTFSVGILLIPVLQGVGATADGKVAWPPASGVQNYEVRTTKTRRLDRETVQAERAARKNAGLHAPARPPNQSVSLTLRVELTGNAERVRAAYACEVDKWRGRIMLTKPAPQAPPLLGNTAIDAFWGHPANRGAKPAKLARNAVEREFEQTFARRGNRSEPASFIGKFGDHLLPVLWDYSLPCWAEQMLVVMDLDNQGDIIGGKTLIQDRSQSTRLGQRETRVELRFEKVSAGAFTMRYKMRVDQMIGARRDGKGNREHPFSWRFDIDGEARYDLTAQAFESVVEKVVGRPTKLDPKLLVDLRDQCFAGEIQLKRIVPKRGKKRRRQ